MALLRNIMRPVTRKVMAPVDGVFGGGAGFIPQYQAVYTAFATKPSGVVADNQEVMVQKLVDDGNWVLTDGMWIYAGHTNTGGESTLQWKAPSGDKAVPINSPIHTNFEGFAGDGAAAHLTLQWNPTDNGSNWIQNAACFIVGTYAVGSAGSARSFGASDSGGTIRTLSYTDGRVMLNSAFNATGAGSGLSKFYTTGQRDGANSVNQYINKGAAVNEAVASTGINSIDFFTHAQNNAGTADVFDDGTLAAIVVGNFTEAQKNQVIDAIDAYMVSNGKGILP